MNSFRYSLFWYEIWSRYHVNKYREIYGDWDVGMNSFWNRLTQLSCKRPLTRSLFSHSIVKFVLLAQRTRLRGKVLELHGRKAEENAKISIATRKTNACAEIQPGNRSRYRQLHVVQHVSLVSTAIVSILFFIFFECMLGKNSFVVFLRVAFLSC